MIGGRDIPGKDVYMLEAAPQNAIAINPPVHITQHLSQTHTHTHQLADIRAALAYLAQGESLYEQGLGAVW